MGEMSDQAEALRPGAVFVTFTKALPSPEFELLERRRYKMSWGPATVFIQRRMSKTSVPLPPYRLNLLPSDEVEYEDPDYDLLPLSHPAPAAPTPVVAPIPVPVNQTLPPRPPSRRNGYSKSSETPKTPCERHS